jgi:hypothetical protein
VYGLFILVALLGMGVHTVQAALPFNYTSGFQVQNIDTVNDATVTIAFYAADGTNPPNSQISDTITKGSSKTYFPLTGLPSGFQGSVVVSSSTKVASVVNILGSGTGGNASASYVGAMSGNSTVLLPLLMSGNSGFNTWFSVQNTGSGSTDVTVNYSDGVVKTKTGLAAGAAVVFDQSSETHSLKVFSATVTASSGGSLAATVVEENNSIMFAYSGFTSGSENVVVPLISENNSGYQTGTQVMNSGATDTVVTVTYTPSAAGTACTETQTVPHGLSRTFTLYAFAKAGSQPPEGGMTTTCAPSSKFIGSASVSNSAHMPLVAITNQYKPNVNGEANNDFDPSQATNQVVLPLIMDRNSTYYTGFSVMNVGAPANVSCTFSGGATYTIPSTALGTNASIVDIQNGKISNKYVGSATCTADGSGKLVAVVNEVSLSVAGDQLMVYEGIPVTP